jgi:hypothetical protein
MANLRYQQQRLQQTEKGVLTSEKQQQCSYYSVAVSSNAGFAFDLLHLSRAIEAVLLSWAFRKSCLSPRVFRG